MNHLSWDEIFSYLEEDDLANRDEVKLHLQECETCTKRLGLAASTQSRMEGIFTTTAPKQSPDVINPLFDTLRELSVETHVGGRLTSRRRRIWISSVSSAAAAIVVGAVLGWNALQNSPNTSGRTASSSTAAVAKATGSSAGTVTTAQSNQTFSSFDDSKSLATTNAAANVTAVRGTAQVIVQDPYQNPISGVHVAFVVDGKVTSLFRTGSDGKTPATQLNVLPDPMLERILPKGLWPQGVVTVVAWKSGYQGLVYYDHGVFLNGSPYQPILTLSPGTGVKMDGPAATNDYHLLIRSSIPYEVESKLAEAEKTGKLANLPKGNSLMQVHVTDETGAPVSGAKIALVTSGNVTGYEVTSKTGDANVSGTGIADWRKTLAQGRVSSDDSTDHVVTTMVVLADGYAPAVGLYEPLNPGATRNVAVHLESNAYRTKHNVNNADSPTLIEGESVPTLADAQQVYNQVLAATGHP